MTATNETSTMTKYRGYSIMFLTDEGLSDEWAVWLNGVYLRPFSMDEAPDIESVKAWIDQRIEKSN